MWGLVVSEPLHLCVWGGGGEGGSWCHPPPGAPLCPALPAPLLEGVPERWRGGGLLLLGAPLR